MNKQAVKEICDHMRGGAYSLGVLDKFVGQPLDETAKNELAAIHVCATMRQDGLSFDEAFAAHEVLMDEAARETLSLVVRAARDADIDTV